MTTDANIRADFEDAYNQSTDIMQPFYKEADIDYQIFLGRHWTDKEVADLNAQNRDAFVYNYVQRNISLMGGYQRKNRLGYGVFGIENNDDETATMLDRSLKFAAQYSNTYNKISDASDDAAICGLSFLSLWLSYDNSMESPDIMTGVESFNSVILDPNFTDQTLFDCKYMARRKYVSKGEAKSLMPKEAKTIDGLPGGIFDNKFPFLAINKASFDYYDDMIAYDEFWQRTRNKVRLVINRLNNQTFIWRKNFRALEALTKAFPFLEVKDKWEPSIRYSVFAQGELLYDGDDPLELNDFPLTPVIATYKSSHWDWQNKLQGYVRPSRDAQIEYNRKRSKMAAMLDQAALSAYMVEDGAIKNIDDLYDPQPVKVIVRKKNTSPESVVKLPNASIEPTLIQLSEMLNRDILQIPGLNEESLGIAEGGNTQVSGSLAKMRAYNSVTILQRFFDNLNLSQKEHGKKMTVLIQKHWSDEKVLRITGLQPTEQFRDVNFAKYDIVVSDTLLTDNQKQVAFVEAIQAMQAGIQIPQKYAISKMVVSDPLELMRAYEEESQASQAQQQALTEQQNLNQRLINAEIVHKLSLAEQQRETAVTRQALAMQHLSNSYESRAKAVLDNIKAAKEIQSTDLDNIMRAIAFLLKIESEAGNQQMMDVKQASNKSEYDVMATNQLNKQEAAIV